MAATATAVLLLDMQNEFVHPDGKLHHEVEDMLKSTNVIANVSNFVDEARRNGALIIHSPVIMSKKEGVCFDEADFDPRSYGQMHGLFDEGSWNAEFAQGVAVLPDDPILRGRKNFSAFQGTKLKQILKERKIEQLFIAGFLTNICVLETAIEASELGFLDRIVVLSDGCATYNEGLHKSTIDTSLSLFCEFATVEEAKRQMIKSEPVQQRRLHLLLFAMFFLFLLGKILNGGDPYNNTCEPVAGGGLLKAGGGGGYHGKGKGVKKEAGGGHGGFYYRKGKKGTKERGRWRRLWKR